MYFFVQCDLTKKHHGNLKYFKGSQSNRTESLLQACVNTLQWRKFSQVKKNPYELLYQVSGYGIISLKMFNLYIVLQNVVQALQT